MILPIDPATLSDLNKAFTDLKAPREKQEKDILQHEDEQYAAWSDHFDNDHITPGDDEEQDIHSTEDEVENEDEHFMFNESFDFQYG